MLAVLNPDYNDVEVGFNNSLAPLGDRDDLDLFLLIALKANRADYIAYFETPLPTIQELEDEIAATCPEPPFPPTSYYIPRREKGEPFGVATLDENGIVPLSQLPPIPVVLMETNDIFQPTENGPYIQLPDGVLKVKVFNPSRMVDNDKLTAKSLPAVDDGYTYDPETFRIIFATSRGAGETFSVDMFS